jgi:hypothetical protein
MKQLDYATLARLLPAWRGLFGNRPATVREAASSAELCDLMCAIGVNNQARGNWIRRHLGRYVVGLRFELATARIPAQWIVRPDPPTLLREFAAAGIAVRLIDGKLTAAGPDETLARVLPELRQRHDDLHEFLTAARETAAALTATTILRQLMKGTL